MNYVKVRLLDYLITSLCFTSKVLDIVSLLRAPSIKFRDIYNFHPMLFLIFFETKIFRITRIFFSLGNEN